MSEKKTEIDLKEGTQIFEFAGLKGFGVGKTTVEFNASKEIVAEHLAAAGRSDLIPLLNDESFTF